MSSSMQDQTVTCDFHIWYDSHRIRYRLFWLGSSVPYKNVLIKTLHMSCSNG